MLKNSTLVAGLLMIFMGGPLHGQNLSTQPAAVQESVRPQIPPGTPFPSSPELRSKSKIVLVRHGCYGTCPRYTVTLFGNGKTVYEGEDFVRVKGHAKTTTSGKAVDDLLRKVNEMDFFTFQPQLGEKCIEDGPTASITVSEPGRQRTVDDKCLVGDAMEELGKAIDTAVHIQQWVFIDANDLQSQIDQGWDVTTRGEGYSQAAVEWDDPEVLRVLVRNGLPIDSRNQDGETLLFRAVLGNRFKSVKVLLELGADPKARDPYGWAPAQNAGSKSIEMCKLFLKYGAGINDQDGAGGTMLINAAGGGDLEIIKFLLDSGANPNLRRKDGYTAAGLAKEQREQYQSLAESTSAPYYARMFGDPELGRASYMATVRRYEVVMEYLRQRGGKE